jgi:Flp pilus assembly protein TadG
MRWPRRDRGQSVVEFALVVTIFLMVLMAVFDLGRGIYQYNGASQAAREIARVTSVHPCSGSPCTLGTSAQTVQVIATQKALIPNLGTPTFSCVDIDGSPATHTAANCTVGDQVKVVILAPYSPITPLMGLSGTWNFQSTSTVAIQ